MVQPDRIYHVSVSFGFDTCHCKMVFVLKKKTPDNFKYLENTD